jgi:AcrR family transcriptional regulator
MGIVPTVRSLGRPRAFDPDKALDAAMTVFWREGYEGASLSALTEAMGINRPSLYATFGDKESLFRKVLERYNSGPGAYVCAALNLSTARASIEAVLVGAADLNTNPNNPCGCLMIKGSDSANEAIRCELSRHHQAGFEATRQRIERGQREGDVDPGANAAELANFFVAVVGGIALQAANGATREELHAVVRTAMRAWPQ